MLEGMYLRSACDWHYDPFNAATIERYLETKHLKPLDVEPLALNFYLSYVEWFVKQKRIETLPTRVEELLARYDQQVQNGLAACPVRPPVPGQKGRIKQLEATNLLLRLRDDKTHVWRFLTDWRVLFDNNRAERLVRPAKVKLKVIGGFRALGGSTAFCILRSIWETNKTLGVNQPYRP
jgi:hypothetical protein